MGYAVGMLVELYHYLTTPCSHTHRRLGYLTDLLGLQARYRRIGDHWQQHLDNSRHLILQSAQQCTRHNRVTIIGSGLLLDIPLVQLSTLFNEVILIDVIQSRAVRQRCKQLGNVTPVEHDITGLAESLTRASTHNKLPTSVARLPSAALASDLIISCNLLTQLAHTPSRYLIKKQGWHADDPQLQQWQRTIMAEHLSLLAQQDGQCCLICDTDHEYRDKSENVIEQQERLLGLPLGKADQQWQWPIAPFGEFDKQHQLLATVQGFCNWSVNSTGTPPSTSTTLY